MDRNTVGTPNPRIATTDMNDMDAANLTLLRQRIDELDEALVELLGQRFDLTHAIGQIKVRVGLDATDPARRAHRAELLETLAQQRGLDADLVQRIYRPLNEEVVNSHRRMGARDPA